MLKSGAVPILAQQEAALRSQTPEASFSSSN